MRTEAMQHTVIILLWDIRQGIYYNSASTYTFPIAFPTHGLGASATGSINHWLTNTAIGITDMNVGDNVKQPGFVLCVGY